MAVSIPPAASGSAKGLREAAQQGLRVRRVIAGVASCLLNEAGPGATGAAAWREGLGAAPQSEANTRNQSCRVFFFFKSVNHYLHSCVQERHAGNKPLLLGKRKILHKRTGTRAPMSRALHPVGLERVLIRISGEKR